MTTYFSYNHVEECQNLLNQHPTLSINDTILEETSFYKLIIGSEKIEIKYVLNEASFESVRLIAQILAKAPGLKSIDMRHNDLEADYIIAFAEHLSNSKSLESLNMSCNKIGSAAPSVTEELAKIPSLLSLWFGHNGTGASSAEAIRNLIPAPKLYEISMACNGMTDDVIIEFAKLKNLHSLCILDNASIGFDALTRLVNIKKLYYLPSYGNSKDIELQEKVEKNANAIKEFIQQVVKGDFLEGKLISVASLKKFAIYNYDALMSFTDTQTNIANELNLINKCFIAKPRVIKNLGVRFVLTVCQQHKIQIELKELKVMQKVLNVNVEAEIRNQKMISDFAKKVNEFADSIKSIEANIKSTYKNKHVFELFLLFKNNNILITQEESSAIMEACSGPPEESINNHTIFDRLCSKLWSFRVQVIERNHSLEDLATFDNHLIDSRVGQNILDLLETCQINNILISEEMSTGLRAIAANSASNTEEDQEIIFEIESKLKAFLSGLDSDASQHNKLRIGLESIIECMKHDYGNKWAKKFLWAFKNNNIAITQEESSILESCASNALAQEDGESVLVDFRKRVKKLVENWPSTIKETFTKNFELMKARIEKGYQNEYALELMLVCHKIINKEVTEEDKKVIEEGVSGSLEEENSNKEAKNSVENLTLLNLPEDLQQSIFGYLSLEDMLCKAQEVTLVAEASD